MEKLISEAPSSFKVDSPTNEIYQSPPIPIYEITNKTQKMVKKSRSVVILKLPRINSSQNAARII